MILFFDTETTGLKPGKICQLSYLMQSDKGTLAKNFFFSVPFVEYSAYMVHGFSVDKLKVLSGGKVFSESIEEIQNDFYSADLIIAHNVDFDLSFLNREFSLVGKTFTYKKSFCSMKETTEICQIPRKNGCGYKYPKLMELCSYFGVSDVEILKDVNRLFGVNGGYHDARFDTTALYLAVNKGMEDKLLFLKNFLGELE